jgi:hypothetical protein
MGRRFFEAVDDWMTMQAIAEEHDIDIATVQLVSRSLGKLSGAAFVRICCVATVRSTACRGLRALAPGLGRVRV